MSHLAALMPGALPKNSLWWETAANRPLVMPAKAGIQVGGWYAAHWIPAFAGMTEGFRRLS